MQSSNNFKVAKTESEAVILPKFNNNNLTKDIIKLFNLSI